MSGNSGMLKPNSSTIQMFSSISPMLAPPAVSSASRFSAASRLAGEGDVPGLLTALGQALGP
ncbi:MAG: hypothetical protein VYC47_04740, partial [Verrucomicrobiota bacterium]|nr:hypothetical protein [Verrucomicrobiota bacterium]